MSTLEQWRRLTGHTLLERYGMTELGMVLSNTLDRRVPGHVGEPMPGVEVRARRRHRRSGRPTVSPGELLVRGSQVFAGYWERPDATAEAFVDGWFRTGDVGVHEPGGYRLLGRSSVDIIKTGGEKVSALEIEEVYRTHPGIADCAVVGLDDIEWGQRVALAAVPALDASPDGDTLRAWGKQRLAAAKVPTRFAFVEELPRNTLGKVVKAGRDSSRWSVEAARAETSVQGSGDGPCAFSEILYEVDGTGRDPHPQPARSPQRVHRA